MCTHSFKCFCIVTYLFLGVALWEGYSYVTGSAFWGAHSERKISIARCFLGAGLGINFWGRAGKEAGLLKLWGWSPMQSSAKPHMKILPATLNQSEGFKAFTHFVDQSLHISCSRKEVWPLETPFSQPRQSQRGLTAEGHLLLKLPGAEKGNLRKGRGRHYRVYHISLPLLYRWYNWGAERLQNLNQVLWPVSGGGGIRAKAVGLHSPSHSPSQATLP